MCTSHANNRRRRVACVVDFYFLNVRFVVVDFASRFKKKINKRINWNRLAENRFRNLQVWLVVLVLLIRHRLFFSSLIIDEKIINRRDNFLLIRFLSVSVFPSAKTHGISILLDGHGFDNELQCPYTWGKSPSSVCVFDWKSFSFVFVYQPYTSRVCWT